MQRPHRIADAEQAKQTGGMLALYPRSDDADKLAIPGGEPPEDLHVTLVYLGDDTSTLSPDALVHAVASLTDTLTVITARVLGHATFNPDGGDDGTQEQCAVYLISDSEQLDDTHSKILSIAEDTVPNLHPQHSPFIPHITCGYSMDPSQLSYTGPVLLDRIGVDIMGQTHYFPLQGATIAPYSD